MHNDNLIIRDGSANGHSFDWRDTSIDALLMFLKIIQTRGPLGCIIIWVTQTRRVTLQR